MRLHRKIKHNEKVCRAHDLGSYAQGQGRNQARGKKTRPSNNSKTIEANLTKLHTKTEHNKKACRAQEPGPTPKATATARPEAKLCPKLCRP